MDKELKWEVEMIQTRFRHLRLSTQQALAVRQMEKEMPLLSGFHEVCSFWEEQDFEWDRWSKILTEGQMKTFEKEQQALLKRQEEEFRQSNEAAVKELAWMQEWVGWLREVYVPGMMQDALKAGVFIVLSKEKVHFLRQEYKRFVQGKRHSAIINHYRCHRRLQPNTLQIVLLRNDEIQLIPDYAYFVWTADEAVRAVADFLLKKSTGMIRHYVEFFEQKATQRGAEYKALRTRHFGDETTKGGWHTTIYPNHSYSAAELGWMSYLLMDPPAGFPELSIR